MANGHLYREILMEMYRDYPAHTLPIWVRDGLIEEGYAEQSQHGVFHLTVDGMEFSKELRPAKAS